MNFTIGDLLRAPHIRAVAFESFTANTRISQVSTDSRRITRGDLFIALRGEKFDGHIFLNVIAKQGAIAAVVDSKWYRANSSTAPKGLPLLVVKDTLHAYGDLAQMYRMKFSIPILLIAGSNGKTTTKDVLGHVLGTSFSLLQTEANYNNHVGLPRMLFSLSRRHEIAVLEIGTNHLGEIARLSEIARPTHGLITNIGREHLEFFKNLRGVAKEELALFGYVHEHNGIAFINADDPHLKDQKKRFGEKGFTFGTSAHATVYSRSNEYTRDGKHRLTLWVGKQKRSIRTNLLAEYAPSLVASVASVAHHFGMPLPAIVRGLERYKPHSKRMEMTKLASDVLVINDCYNANPESFVAALETLKKLPAAGKKYVVAGDMFELGQRSKPEHSKLGKKMASYRFDGYFFTGQAMKFANKELERSRINGWTKYFDRTDSIATHLRTILKRGDIVLLKGSRGMKMEEVLNALSKK